MSCNIQNCSKVIGILCKSCEKRAVYCLEHGHSHHIYLNHEVIFLNKELAEKLNIEALYIAQEIEISQITEDIYLIISELKKLLRDKIKEVKSLDPYKQGERQIMNSDLITEMLIKIKIIPDFKKEIEFKQLRIEELQNKLNEYPKNQLHIPEMEKKIKELEEKIEEYTKMISKIPDNDGKFTNIEAKIEYCIKLNADIPKLESRIIDLEGGILDCSKNHSGFITDIQKYKKEIEELKDKLGNFELLRKFVNEYDEEIRRSEERRKIEFIRNESERI